MAAVRHLDLIITSNATAAIRGFSDLGAIAKSVEGRFGKLAGVMAKVGTVGAAAAVGFTGASVKAFIDFDDAMTKSLALMDEISGPQRKKMEDAAKSVAKVTTFSAIEAAEGYQTFASAGYSAEQAMAAIEVAAVFAQASTMDLNSATEYLVDTQAALGLRMEDPIENMQQMTRVADVLTEANRLATGEIEDFAAALQNKAAAALRTTNKDIEEGVAVLAYLAEQGVKGSAAGEKLAIALRDIPRAAARNTEEFQRLGISVFDSSGNLKNMAEIVGEFEKALGPMSDAERAASLENLGLTRSVGDVIRQLLGGSERIAEFETALRGAGGASKEVADKQLESLRSKLQLLKNRFQNVMITFGEPVAVWLVDTLLPWIDNVAIPKLEELAAAVSDTLAPAFDTLDDIFDNQAVQDFATIYGGLLLGFHGAPAAVTVAEGAFMSLKATLKNVLKFALAPFLKTYQALLWSFTNTPKAIAKARTAIGGFVLWANIASLPITGALAGFWAAVAPIVAPFAAFVAALGLLVLYTKLAADNFGELWTFVLLFLGPIGIAGFILGAIIANFDKIKEFGSDVWGGVTDGADALGDALAPVGDFLSRLPGMAKDAATGIWDNALFPALSAVGEFITGTVVPAFQRIWEVASGVFADIGGFFVEVWEGTIGPVLGALAEAWASTVSGLWDAVSTFVTEQLVPAFGDAKDAIVDTFNNITEVVSRVWNEAIQPILSRIADIAGNVFGRLADIASGAFSGVISAVSTAFGVVSDVVSGVFERVKEAVGDALGAVAEFVSVHIVPAFVRFKDTATEVFGNVASAVNDAWVNVIRPALGQIWEFIEARIIPVFNRLKEFVGEAWQRIQDAASLAWSIIGPILSDLWGFIEEKIIPAFEKWAPVVVGVLALIGSYFMFSWTVLILPVLAGLTWFLTYVVSPAFEATRVAVETAWTIIGAVISFAWNYIILPIFNSIVGIINTVIIPTFNFLKDTAQVVWSVIQSAISFAWNYVIRPTFDAIVGFINNIIIPGFNFLRDTISSVWDGIKSAISTAWNWIRDHVFSPIKTFVTETIPDAFRAMRDGIGEVWASVKSAAKSAWDSIKNAVRSPVNSIIGFVNDLIGGINKVLDMIPGLSGINIPEIPTVSSGPRGGSSAANANRGPGGSRPTGYEAGGELSRIGPFRTNGPMVLVGEGNPRYPEYVIPTDPRHRGRALSLFDSLGGDLHQIPAYGIGGIIGGLGDAFSAGAGWIKDKALDVTGGLFRRALEVIFSPINTAVKNGLAALPNPLHMVDVAQGIREAVWQWVKGADSGLPEEPPPPPAGGGVAGAMLGPGGGLAGLREPIASVAAKMLALGNGRIFIRSGWRSSARQAQLYADYLAGRGNLAAPPGRSKHERGLAVDWGGQLSVWQSLARQFGAHFPVRGENWHMEMPGYAKGGIVGHEGGLVHPSEMVLTPRDQVELLTLIRSGQGNNTGTTINVEPGAVVIQLPPGADEGQGRRAGAAAAKEFMNVLAERRVMTEVRID